MCTTHITEDQTRPRQQKTLEHPRTPHTTPHSKTQSTIQSTAQHHTQHPVLRCLRALAMFPWREHPFLSFAVEGKGASCSALCMADGCKAPWSLLDGRFLKGRLLTGAGHKIRRSDGACRMSLSRATTSHASPIFVPLSPPTPFHHPTHRPTPSTDQTKPTEHT